MVYPIKIAHPFGKGEFSHFPMPNVAGAQVNVKARHDDGSCRHAWFYLVFGGNPGESGQITFSNVATVDNAGMTVDQMLAACPDIEFQLWDQNFTQLNHSVLLRNMIVNFATVNASGPICTDITVHDPAGSVDGTFGSGGLFLATGNPTVRPIWYIQFWPTINRVHVRLAVETGSTKCIQESWYSTRILLNGVKVYEHAWDVQGAAKKWFWSQWIGDPVGEVAINHNLAHLAQSKALPNYDTTIQLQQAAVDGWKQRYASAGLSDFRADKGNSNAGLWLKGMSTAGTRPDLGIAPEWTIDYLYSGDQDLLRMTLEECERACNYQFFYRETYQNRSYGNAPRVDDRPKSDFLQPGLFADGFEVTGDKDGWGWGASDRQHFPDPFYAAYLITGEQWLLDCMTQWAAFVSGTTNGATSDNRGRGPTGAEGCIGLPQNYGCRGPGHILQIMAQAAFIQPDTSPYKSYFDACIVNTLAAYEGNHGITGTALDSNPCKAWAASVEIDDNILHLWGKPTPYGTAIVDDTLKPNVALTDCPMWEHAYMNRALASCVEMGHPADALLAWMRESASKFATATMPGPLCAGLQKPTRLPVGGMNGQLFSTVDQIVACFVDGFDFNGVFYGPLDSDKNGGYPCLAVVTMSSLGLWQWYGPNAYDITDWSYNPHWAIKPR